MMRKIQGFATYAVTLGPEAVALDQVEQPISL